MVLEKSNPAVHKGEFLYYITHRLYTKNILTKKTLNLELIPIGFWILKPELRII
jgi:hypothetical protein